MAEAVPILACKPEGQLKRLSHVGVGSGVWRDIGGGPLRLRQLGSLLQLCCWGSIRRLHQLRRAACGYCVGA